MRNWLLFVLSSTLTAVVGLELAHVSIEPLSCHVLAALWATALAAGAILVALVLPMLALALAVRPFREADDEAEVRVEGAVLQSGVSAPRPVASFE